MVGGGHWAGVLVALAVIISGIGALNGWTMICGEMPRAAAQDGLFPPAYGRLSRQQMPVVGIVASTALASVAMAVSFMGTSGATVFNTLVLMTGITVAIPYAFSALAQIMWRWRDQKQIHTARFARDMGVAVVALIFSILFIWYSRNTGQQHWYEVWGPFLMAGAAMLVGIPVYVRMRTRMTAAPAVPPWPQS
jgi:APA family basic amino acid/polyamine antiporter